MAFTVTRTGAGEADFEAYARLLRQQGADLAHLPRVPDPEAPDRRWGAAWSAEPDARRFADELAATTGAAWQVLPTDATPTLGPLGPLLFQLARRADGLTFALHPLSRAVIGDGFADAVPRATSVFLDPHAWADFQRAHGGLSELVAELAPVLTGQSAEQLAEWGYALLDADTGRAWVRVPPVGVGAVHA